MATKVYKFGARAPSDAPLLRAQMKLGREYYNALVEAENDRRKRAWGADVVPAPPHEDCKDKKCRECREHWQGIRKRVRDEPLVDAKPLRTEFAARGLYWGTYLCIEDAWTRSWKDRDVLRLVKFRSWRKGGVVGVQIQRHCWERNRGATIFQTEGTGDTRGRRARFGGRQLARLRIGSVERTSPVWSESLRYEQHRAIEGRVTWVKISMKPRGDREVWSVAFTCADIPARPASDEAIRGVVAVDVGWRRVGDDLRIAYARSDQGVVSELRMGPKWRELWERADRIRGHRDDGYNALVALELEVPGQSRSANGLRSAVEQAIRAGEEVAPEVRAWMHRDRHLAQYESGCRERSVNRRVDAMRNWARDLRRKYKTLVLKKTSTKQQKETAKGDGMVQSARRQGQHAAPGEVLEHLMQVFGRDNTSLVKSAHTTNECPGCHYMNDHGPETIVTCEGCGESIDRDEASTRNVMRAWASGESDEPTARKTTARFVKRHTQPEEPPQC